MDKLINDIQEKIDYNDYYINNYAFYCEFYKKLCHINSLFNKKEGLNLCHELSKLTLEDMERFFILTALFFSSKEKHDFAIDAIDCFIRDEKNNSSYNERSKRYQKFLDFMALNNDNFPNTEKGYSKEDLSALNDALFNLFSDMYGKKSAYIYKELSKTNAFFIGFLVLFDFNKIKNFRFDEYNLTVMDVVNNLKNYSKVEIYPQNETVRIAFACLQLRLLIEYINKEIMPTINKEIKINIRNKKNLEKELKKITDIYSKSHSGFISDIALEGLLDGIPNEFEVLEYVSKMSCHIAEKKELHFGSKEKLKILLSKYGYDYDKLSNYCKTNVDNINIESIEESLNILGKLKIALSYSNLSQVILDGINIPINELTKLTSIQYINSSVINDNILLLTNVNSFNNFSENISTLKKKHIDIRNLIKSSHRILFINHYILEYTLKMYNLYKIKITNENIEYLIDPKKLDVIDGFIEEGYENFIFNNTDILKNNNNELVKRIHISHLIGEIPIEANTVNERLLSEKTFFISDKKLDEACCSKTDDFVDKEIISILDNSPRVYISNDVVNNEYIKYLDKTYREFDNYNINGVIISRLKVLRNLEALKSTNYSMENKIINSILYNSLLTVDNIHKIIDTLFDDVNDKHIKSI